MRIDGKAIAEGILENLAKETEMLIGEGIMPTLAVILIGDNPASLAYIKQKQKAAERIGAHIIFDHQPTSLTSGGLFNLIHNYNTEPEVHGLIIQRPIPSEVGRVADVLNKVAPQKDVDGFLPGSSFDVPVAAAVGEILKNAHATLVAEHKTTERNFAAWLRAQKIAVIGRGETAGAPIARYLEKQHCTTSIIHSKTPDPKRIMRQADVIISCVGKERVVPKEAVKPDAVLISVGIWRDAAGKLRGDYEEEEIADIASLYTPTPGGVGPVNVACLMQNLIKACTMNVKGA